MTNEEKYKKALEVIKSLYNKTKLLSSGEAREITLTLEENFPELKESEDEKIRKELIDYLIDHDENGYLLHNDRLRWVTWLEKQGEQKSVMNVPSREIILAIWDLGNEWEELTKGSFSTEYGTQLEYIQKHWQESKYYLRAKQGKQKPTDKIEPKFKVGDIIKYVGEREEFSKENYIIKKILDDCYLTIDDTYIPFKFEEYYIPIIQNHSWSKEDEKMVESCLLFVNANRTHPSATKCIDWLKSLKPRSHWKPSEEQMKALKLASDKDWDIDGNSPLYTLYNDLKKL